MNHAADDAMVRARGYLPHWERRGAICFITFRLADSLPHRVIEQADQERQEMEQRLAREACAGSREKLAILEAAHARMLEKYLDAGYGECALRDHTIAEVVRGELHHFDGSRYDLFCWCIMPNHVHTVVRPIAPHTLAKIVHSWKSFSAKAVNRMRGSSGHFWQREYYDRVIRDEDHLRRAAAYVTNNPTNAGLASWPWVYMSERIDVLLG